LLYDGANVVQEAVEGSATANLLTGLESDQLFSRTTEGGTDSYLTDHLGSAIALANGSGEIGTTYSYDPFGRSTEGGEPSDNPFQFTGRENDGTGLQYNRARYYSPSFSRFISRDPAGFEGSGDNLYWYVNDNPLDFTDPSGECFVCIPSFNPVAPLEDAADQVGDWVSEAPGVASDIAGFIAEETDVSTEELIGAMASAGGSAAMCGIMAAGASAVGTPVAGAAAYGACSAIEAVGAYETTTDILDHENELWTNELFR
jgi:RHS repeat-associated protein